jgi:two-component SAPR family response regulator
MNIIVADDDKVLSKMICGILNEAGHITVPAFDRCR